MTRAQLKTNGIPATPRTLPGRRAKTAAIAGCALVTQVEAQALLDSQNEEDVIDDAIDESVVLQPPPVLRNDINVFQTFSTKSKLPDGLCIIRGLGQDRYEIVNLDSLTADDLTTPKIKAELSTHESRVEMFDIHPGDWEGAQFKCNQALMGAASAIFHFMKLPIEIRYFIYELALIKEKRLTFRSCPPADPNRSINTALLRTSHTVYDEAVKFLQANTFYVNYSTVRSINILDSNQAIITLDPTKNIRTLEITLDGSFKTDSLVADLIAKCQNLKKLKIEYGERLLATFVRSKRQYLCQDDPRAVKFRQLNGHDILCSLRGLDKLEIVAEKNFNELHHTRLKQKDLKDYQQFLHEIVTLPKPTDEEIAAKEELERLQAEIAAEEAETKIRKRKRAKRRSKFVGDDEEYDGSWD